METVMVLGVVLAAIPVGYGAGAWIHRRYRKYKGPMVVVCPETQHDVGVEVDAGRATLAEVAGISDIDLTSCTRWPDRNDCGRECLQQIDLAPEEHLVSTQLARWFEGKSCCICGTRFTHVESKAHKPALLDPEAELVDWDDVDPVRLRETLETHRPVCFNCHLAIRIRRDYPDRVYDMPVEVRPRRAVFDID
jgi:hypothetical protein